MSSPSCRDAAPRRTRAEIVAESSSGCHAGQVTDPGELYDRASPTYGMVGPPIFEVLGQQLVNLVNVRDADRVLDIGCGRGAALVPAAREVGTRGLALGVDVSFEMVRQTKGALAELGSAPAGVLQASARAIPVSGRTVDRLLCAFTVFWLTDPSACFEEMRRVVRRDGVLGISMTFGSDERWAWYGRLLLDYHERHGVLARQPVGNGLNQNPEALEEALIEAGFEDVRSVFETTTFTFPSVETWWQFQWSHGARLPLEAMSAPVLREFKNDCRTRLAGMETAHGIQQDWPMAFTIAA